MKKWQEERNYRRIRNELGQIVANIITVDGVDVEVSDEVYQAYAQADRRERYVIEEAEAGKMLSLDKLLEDHVPLESLGVEQAESAEETTIAREERETREKQKVRLVTALSQLTQDEQRLLQALFFDGASVREYARQLGVQHHTIQYRRDRLLEKLRKNIF